MERKSWYAVLTLAVVLMLTAGDAIAKKGGGGKPGGGEDPGNTTPLDILVTIDGGLYALQDDGTGLTYLAPERGGHAWSPDGTQVAFYSDGLSDGYGIYVMDLETGTSEQLISMSLYSAGWLDWCPVPESDGTHRLAFTMRDQATGVDAYVAYFDEDGLVDYEPVTATAGDEQSLTWSPTGDQIAAGYIGAIRVLDLANRDGVTGLPAAHTVYSSTQLAPNYPTWAKTGNQIAFTASDSSVSYPLQDIYVMTVSQDASTDAWTGTTPVNLTNTPNDEENGTLSWSPDDSQIVCFSAYWRKLGKGIGKVSLQLVDATTGSRSKLADSGTHPAWRR